MRSRSLCVLLATCLLVAACSDDSSEDAGRSGTTSSLSTVPQTTAAVAQERARYEAATTCPMKIPTEVEVKVDCGWLYVPENRLDPGSRTIKLAVARLHSRARRPKADPVVQLEGGPGFPSLTDVADYATSKILDQRDYILWDQRGVGYSRPNLDCEETNEAIWAIFSTTDQARVEGKRIESSLVACRKRIVAGGVDLDGYNTTQNAADLADLRVALGIDEWNLRGISYGSALAIEAVRNHREGIRSVLLDSVVAPDDPFGAVGRGESGLRAFAELFDACDEGQACTSRYGDLEALMKRAGAALDAEPYRTTIADPGTGEERPIAITGQDLYAGLFNALYDETLIPAVPGVINGIADGERAVIDLLAADGIPFATGQAEAMTASVDCADRGRLLQPDRLAPFVARHPELGALIYLSAPETGCAAWGVKQARASFNRLLAEDTAVPIIVMAGRFDPITPPSGSRRVAEALGLELLMFPNAGHGAVGSSDCARGIWFAFMDDPAQPPDTACMGALRPPTFT